MSYTRHVICQMTFRYMWMWIPFGAMFSMFVSLVKYKQHRLLVHCVSSFFFNKSVSSKKYDFKLEIVYSLFKTIMKCGRSTLTQSIMVTYYEKITFFKKFTEERITIAAQIILENVSKT